MPEAVSIIYSPVRSKEFVPFKALRIENEWFDLISNCHHFGPNNFLFKNKERAWELCTHIKYLDAKDACYKGILPQKYDLRDTPVPCITLKVNLIENEQADESLIQSELMADELIHNDGIGLIDTANVQSMLIGDGLIKDQNEREYL